MSTYVNSKTGNTVERHEPQDEEYIYTGKPLVLETDSERVITYANKRFVEASGYTKEEVIGSPHSRPVLR